MSLKSDQLEILLSVYNVVLLVSLWLIFEVNKLKNVHNCYLLFPIKILISSESVTYIRLYRSLSEYSYDDLC